MTENKPPQVPVWRASPLPEPNPGPNQAFVAVLDAVPGSWFFARRDGSFAYVNLGACESVGYTRDQLLRASIFDIDPTVNREQWEQLWLGTRPSESVILRTTHRRRDGVDFPVEVRATRLVVDGEDLAVSYSVDLTASERTREALARTEAELGRLLRHLPDLVFRLRRSPSVGWLFASPSCKALLGYEAQELLSGSVELPRLLHPHDVDAFLSLGESETEIRFLHREGHTVWMAVRATEIEGTDAGELVIEGVARDITKRHQAELQWRRLLTGIEHSAEAIVITDTEGRLEYVNPAYENSSGLRSVDVLGKHWAGLEVRHDAALLSALPRVVDEQETWSGRTESVRSTGETYHEDITLSPFRDADGAFAGLVAVKRDVTDQLRLEAQLIQAQKMEAVGQLAGGIAHDFNNLLFIAMGNIDLVRLRSRSANQSTDERLHDAQAALERASTLVKQLLTFSRKGNVETSVLALDKIVQGSLGMLSRLLGEHIRLDFERSTEGPLLLVGNAAQIEQVIVNLCVNARDAMPEGGSLQLTLDEVARHAVPDVSGLAPAQRFARITVSDTGHGMPADVRERVFEPFFTTKEPGRGTGLGLATAYAIVQQHRGQMQVDSEPGVGTTFRIHLPLSDADEPVPRSSRAPSQLQGRGRWVLVAEDEPSVRQLLAHYLEDAGFRVVAVANGRKALDVLDQRGNDFALVVLDAVMPELGGRGVLQFMRERSLQTPVLFVTGYDNESLVEVRDAPNVAVLGKPFNPEKLARYAAKLL